MPLPFGYDEISGKDAQFPTLENYNFLSGEFEAKRIFKGPWIRRFDFLFNYLLQPVILGGTNLTIFSIPNPYPDAPIAYADSAEVVGMGKAIESTSGLAQWDRAQITVTYRIPPFNIASGNFNEPEKFVKRIFIDESFESNIEFLSKDSAKLKLKDPPNTELGEEHPTNFLITLGTFKLSQEYIIVPRWYEIDNAYGKVNDRPFIMPSGFTCPKETLRYEGHDSDTKVNIHTQAGENAPFPVFRLEHTFAYNKHGWNTKHVDGEFQEVVFVDNSKPMYETADLYTIFFGFGNNTFDKNTLDNIQTKFDDLKAHIDGGGTIEDFTAQGILNNITTLRKSLGFRV